MEKKKYVIAGIVMLLVITGVFGVMAGEVNVPKIKIESSDSALGQLKIYNPATGAGGEASIGFSNTNTASTKWIIGEGLGGFLGNLANNYNNYSTPDYSNTNYGDIPYAPPQVYQGDFGFE